MSRTMAGNVLFKIEGTKGRKVTKVAHTGEENIPLELGSPLGDIRERDYKQVSFLLFSSHLFVLFSLICEDIGAIRCVR